MTKPIERVNEELMRFYTGQRPGSKKGFTWRSLLKAHDWKEDELLRFVNWIGMRVPSSEGAACWLRMKEAGIVEGKPNKDWKTVLQYVVPREEAVRGDWVEVDLKNYWAHYYKNEFGAKQLQIMTDGEELYVFRSAKSEGRYRFMLGVELETDPITLNEGWFPMAVEKSECGDES